MIAFSKFEPSEDSLAKRRQVTAAYSYLRSAATLEELTALTEIAKKKQKFSDEELEAAEKKVRQEIEEGEPA